MPSTQELFGDDDSSSSSAVSFGKEEKGETSSSKVPYRSDDKDGEEDNNNNKDTSQLQHDARKDRDDQITYSTDTVWSVPVFESPNHHHNKIQPVLLKLPNFMGIQTQPFTPENYDPAQEEEYFGPQSVWNLMRYRYAAETNRKERESNTRLVEWEDGSYTLHIGAEAFTIDLMDNTLAHPTNHHNSHQNENEDEDVPFPGLNGYLYVSHKASTGQRNTTTTTTLECVHPMRARGTMKPTSLQSAAHKALTVSIRQQTIHKRAKIANYQTTQDPEKLKQERIKVKQDLEKAALARGGTGDAGRRGPRSRPRRSRAYMEDDVDEEDEDYDTTNIKAMKRRTYNDEDDDGDEDDFGNDDDDDDEEDDEGATFHRVRPHKKQARVEKEKVDLLDDDDDDDDVVLPVVKANNKRNTQSLFDDDDSDD